MIFIFELSDLVFLDFYELKTWASALLFLVDQLGRAGVDGNQTTASQPLTLQRLWLLWFLISDAGELTQFLLYAGSNFKDWRYRKLLCLKIEFLVLAPWRCPSIGINDQPLYYFCLLCSKRLLLGLLYLVQLLL